MSRYWDDFLEHASSERKNHKYIARVNEGNHMRYFYNQAEIAAYRARKAGGKLKKALTPRHSKPKISGQTLSVNGKKTRAGRRTSSSSSNRHYNRGRNAVASWFAKHPIVRRSEPKISGETLSINMH